jgi:hypothetical protein
MFTRKKKSAVILVLAVLLALAPVTFAQEATEAINDWAGLKTVTPGSKLEVKLKSGKKVKGNLISASDTTLSLSDGAKSKDLNKNDVLSVQEVRGMTAKKATLIGAGVGLGAGAGLGAALGGRRCDPPGTPLGGCSNERPFVTAFGAVLGIVFGAVTGFAIGKSGHKRILIYQAKRP